ncbi:MAG TPA: L,D-transpeptidase [Solirubrobacteraceae bacterium]|nr:L,D-transpeptidase [Solirubrobacteraceae bacterium]
MRGQIASTRRGLRAAAVCAAWLSALAVPAVGQAARAEHHQARHHHLKREVLSHPGYASTWAYLEAATDAYASPSRHALVLGYLPTTTQDATSQLLLEQQRVLIHGGWWVQVRLPLRPAGQIGWVPQRALGAPQTVHTYLVVSTEKTTLTLYRNGKVIFQTRVGTGKPSTPTPHGQFYIRDRLDAFAPGSIFGPVAFGTSALSDVETDWPGGGVIGIHGTNEPSLIPGHPSHGCIRLPNWEIVKLARLLPIGTPLTIK